MAGPLTKENPRRVEIHGAGSFFDTTIFNGEPGNPSPTCAKCSASPSAWEERSPRAGGGALCPS